MLSMFLMILKLLLLLLFLVIEKLLSLAVWNFLLLFLSVIYKLSLLVI